MHTGKLTEKSRLILARTSGQNVKLQLNNTPSNQVHDGEPTKLHVPKNDFRNSNSHRLVGDTRPSPFFKEKY